LARIDQLTFIGVTAAMREAVAHFRPAPTPAGGRVRVTGVPADQDHHATRCRYHCRGFIIAKVHRDEMIRRWAPVYPV